MIRYDLLLASLAVATLANATEPGAVLQVSGNTHSLEMAPVWSAARTLGQAAVNVSDGGVESLFGTGGADVAADTEIQTLRSSVAHPDLRVVFTIAEGYCRIVARKSAGIGKLGDLRGKKIGTVTGSPFEYSLQKLLGSAGLNVRDAVVVSVDSVAQAAAALRDGKLDALSVPEPAMQSAAELLGADAIEFQNRAVYRELFNLNTTRDRLADPARRGRIVAFVAGLIRASGQIRTDAPESTVPLVAAATGFEPGLIGKSWRQQAYYGTLVHDLPDVMAAEDGWLSREGTRAPRTRAELVSLVDPTVRLDAVELLKQQSAPTQGPEDAGTLVQARERIQRLSAGVDNVEAIRAVKVLQHAYAQYVEQGRWSDAVALFADDAVAQFGETTVRGSHALQGYLLQAPGAGKDGLATGRLNLRIVLSPVINLSADGAHAKGRWHEVALLGEFGKAARWEGGIYENDYLLEKGVWKVARLHYYPQYAGPYDSGWRSLPQASAVVPYHYDAHSAGKLIPDEARNLVRVQLPERLPALAAHLAGLEQRLQRLNDASDVQNLQHAFGYYVDRKLWDDAADLFSTVGSIEIGSRNAAVGKESIRRALDQSGGGGMQRGELNDHLQLETLVHMAPGGRTAYARGIQLGMTSAAGSGQWSESLYDGEYVKEGGVWVIRSLRIYPRMATDYADGWAKSALPDGGLGNRFPQDRPLGPQGGMYPAAHFPAMSFPHPVKQAANPPRGAAFPRLRTLPELLERTREAERKLRVAEAYDGAENVSNAYGYYIDEFKWDDSAELFARDGWKELSYIGTYVGRERVRQSMISRYGSNGRTGKLMTLHQKTQPVVHVAPDGASARIRERLFQFNSSIDAPGSYIGGIYENEVVNEDGAWKISAMDLDYVWTTLYTTGWAHATPEDGLRFAPPPGAPPPPLAPDRPLRGVVTAPFPEIVDVPFHYVNPVSGRAPAVLLLP